MQFVSPINIQPLQPFITYHDKIMLTGSCFTEHIGNYLSAVKFNTLQNPNGIIFNPVSVCSSLISYIQNKQYKEDDLVYLNEMWSSWQHHSRFSNIDKDECLKNINTSQNEAHEFLRHADWLIITLGSSFVYKLADTMQPVANCHKAPAQNFIKYLLSIEEIVTCLDSTVFQLFHFNPELKIIFTISPVRHLRDGMVENNRSKARLIEAVHHLVNKFDKLHYFPAYELVVDVLRDYRFYDIDLAHPNYAATQFVLEKFSENCFDKETLMLIEKIKKMIVAKKHRPFNSSSNAHKQFLENNLNEAKHLKSKYPFLNLDEEINYFNKH